MPSVAVARHYRVSYARHRLRKSYEFTRNSPFHSSFVIRQSSWLSFTIIQSLQSLPIILSFRAHIYSLRSHASHPVCNLSCPILFPPTSSCFLTKELNYNDLYNQRLRYAFLFCLLKNYRIIMILTRTQWLAFVVASLKISHFSYFILILVYNGLIPRVTSLIN